MSRASSISSSRNLSLTEELEKLEQSITLTLQEIDHNFSRAHQIVTTSILPIVERYADQSRAVWDASKFWKEFFEASANVSLSGYEERAGSERDVGEEAEGDSSHDLTITPEDAESADEGDDSYAEDTATATLASTQQATVTQRLDSSTVDNDDEAMARSILDSPSLIKSTPRAKGAAKVPANPTIAQYPSPYEALKQEYQAGPSSRATPGAAAAAATAGSTLKYPKSPGMTSKLPVISQTPLRAQAQAQAQSRRRHGGATTGGDVLLHRVLDKTYRIQATPHKTPASQIRTRRHPPAAAMDSSPPSSPDLPPPQLNPDVFSPSTRRKITAANSGVTSGKKARHAAMTTTTGIGVRTPKQGLSILRTPRQQRGGPSALEHVFSSKRGQRARFDGGTSGRNSRDDKDDEDEDDSDDDWGEIEGMSPPKTIQFAVPPSRLLRTPAKEASKRIVQDLLLTAGANDTATTTTTDELTRDMRDMRLRRDVRRAGAGRHHHDDDDDDDDHEAGAAEEEEEEAEDRENDVEEDDDDDEEGGKGRNEGAYDVEDDNMAEPTSPVFVRGKGVGGLTDTF